MSDLRTAAQQALEAIDKALPYAPHCGEFDALADMADALRDALEEPVQEPVAWIEHEWSGTGQRRLHFEKRQRTVRDEVVNPVWTPLYLAPPQRKPLTNEELMPYIKRCADYYGFGDKPLHLTLGAGLFVLARAIERAHGIEGKE